MSATGRKRVAGALVGLISGLGLFNVLTGEAVLMPPLVAAPMFAIGILAACLYIRRPSD